MSRFSIDVQAQDGKRQLTINEQVDDLPVWGCDAPLRVVSTPVPRLEAFEKVTGRAQYTSDVRLPRQAYARVLRSPHPHARITSVDTSAAEAIPGVFAVLHAGNTDRIPWYDGSAIFDPEVRLIGDEVAAVAAVSEEIAEDALRAIRVDYDILPFVTALETAERPGAIEVRPDAEGEGNVSGEPKVYTRGDVDAALRAAEVIVDETFSTQSALHNALESHSCTASWDDDALTMWTSTQSVFSVRSQVAGALGLDEQQVRVIKHHMGGGFGAKQISWKEDVIAAILSRATGRPVQLLLDRKSENLVVGNRAPSRQHVRLGARQDGTLVAIDADIHQPIGAYMTGGEASNVSGMYQTLYRCDNVRTVQTSLFINANPAVAFRGPGHVEAAWGLEQAMDMLADKLGMDPIELRLKNYADTEQLEGKPYSLPEGLRLSYERVKETYGWDTRPAPVREGRYRRGVGFAAHDWVGGSGHPPGYAWIEMNTSGTVDVVTGTQDIGTGTRTGLAQVAAEELGLPLSAIRMHLGDTGVGPYSPTSAGSMTQATIGPAIRNAAHDLRDQLLRVASALLDIPVERLSVCNGHVLVDGTEEGGKPVSDVMAAIGPTTLRAHGARGPLPEDVAVRTFGSQIIEVEVDIDTGEITVTKIVASHECGRVINPLILENQVIGAVTQGTGYGLIEERLIDDRLGRVLNPNLEEYLVPTMLDIPEIVNVPVDVPDTKANPTAAKGIGEPPLIPTAPAISNAVYNATGIRFRHSPITRRDVLDAIHDLEGRP